ncbi:unnamed protein product [Effrenium voratum]|uniref:Uncharacterized protein n=1 Tax=Effrenium voratum TaxID=2562239 RepID=A0AA36HV56_9DINO|nr:unnamed protein product [Effrenium voratum]
MLLSAQLTKRRRKRRKPRSSEPFQLSLVLVNPATSFDRTAWPLLGRALAAVPNEPQALPPWLPHKDLDDLFQEICANVSSCRPTRTWRAQRSRAPLPTARSLGVWPRESACKSSTPATPWTPALRASCCIRRTSPSSYRPRR